MPDGFRVNPDALLAAVARVGTAEAALDGASGDVEAMHNLMQSSSTMDQGTGADNRIESFRNRWKDEFNLISDMLTGLQEAIEKAAEAYATSDAAFAAQLNDIRAGMNG